VRAVIIGGPCTGKTTLCKTLANRGYITIPESAREIIAEQQPHGILPWTDLAGFQELVIPRQLGLEDKLNGEPAFLDRGLLDNIAYCRLGNIPAPRSLQGIQLRARYTHTFLLERLPYRADAERKESPEEGARVHTMIATVYREYGYNLIHIPVSSVEARADLIEQHVR
jgi:predicted ATPase